MKGESIGAGKQIADPLTLGMLERLEGIVKIRHQMKFSVRSGRAYLVFGVALLLVFSIFQWSWEFAKVLTYQNRFFSKAQISAIDASSNLHMYWPSYARAAGVAGVDDAWSFHRAVPAARTGAALPGDGANSARTLYRRRARAWCWWCWAASPPRPSTSTSSASASAPAICRRHRAADALPDPDEPAQLDRDATGITPDLVGVLGNRNIGTTAYDNIFRMMRRFSDAWHTDRSSQYA